jgi:hypothetical protein
MLVFIGFLALAINADFGAIEGNVADLEEQQRPQALVEMNNMRQNIMQLSQREMEVSDTCTYLKDLDQTSDVTPTAAVAQMGKLADMHKNLCDESTPMVDLFYRIIVVVNCKVFTRGWRTFFAALATSETTNECDVVKKCHKSHLDRYDKECGIQNGENPPERFDLRLSDIQVCMGKAPMLSMLDDDRFLRLISVRNPLARLASAFHTLHYSDDFRTKAKREEFEQWLETEVVPEEKSGADCTAHLSLVGTFHTDWHMIPQHCKFGFDSNIDRFRMAQLERPEQLQTILLSERPELAKLAATKPFMSEVSKSLLLHMYEIDDLRWFFGGENGTRLLQQVVTARAREIEVLGYKEEVEKMLKMFQIPVTWKLSQNKKFWDLASPPAEDLLHVFRDDLR